MVSQLAGRRRRANLDDGMMQCFPLFRIGIEFVYSNTIQVLIDG
jgi:hypothetical protein